MKIKVCGITKLEEAMVMESWGVEMLGFNFVSSSKRLIKPSAAQAIICELSPATACAGVFVNPSEGEVRSIIEQTGIDTLQFHGQEKPELLSAFANYRRIKVFSVDENFKAEDVIPYLDCAEAFLFDAKMGSEVGGTGISFDWSRLSGVNHSKPWFLAGGIGPENCVEATRLSGADYLDLNSKIEKSPGIKDLNLLDQCLQALAQAKLFP